MGVEFNFCQNALKIIEKYYTYDEKVKMCVSHVHVAKYVPRFFARARLREGQNKYRPTCKFVLRDVVRHGCALAVPHCGVAVVAVVAWRQQHCDVALITLLTYKQALK